MKTRVLVSMLLAFTGSASAGKPTVMGAFYDGQLFNINFTELPPGGETATEQHNMSKNTIYQCDACAASGLDFTSVIDAIQGDGFNPLWEEVQITFITIPPQQFTSDTEILNAAAAGQIMLTDTEEMYRCSVLGPKK